MFAVAPAAAGAAKPALYADLLGQARALLAGERDAGANSANLAALLFHALPDLNWAGFYWLKDGGLVLGPFQGKPACVRIAVGKGVCGTAAATGRTVVVPDVHAFPGHIACDSRSNSEIVIPVFDKKGELAAVLDVDSTQFAAFDEIDEEGLRLICAGLLTLD